MHCTHGHVREHALFLARHVLQSSMMANVSGGGVRCSGTSTQNGGLDTGSRFRSSSMSSTKGSHSRGPLKLFVVHDSNWILQAVKSKASVERDAISTPSVYPSTMRKPCRMFPAEMDPIDRRDGTRGMPKRSPFHLGSKHWRKNRTMSLLVCQTLVSMISMYLLGDYVHSSRLGTSCCTIWSWS